MCEVYGCDSFVGDVGSYFPRAKTAFSTMAAASSHSKVFKKTRVTLIRELPDPGAMLDSPELRDSFSGYEKSQVLSPPTLCGRAEKLVDVLELSSDAALFRNFVAVLRRLKPKLATDLEDALVEVEAASDRASSDAGAGRVLLFCLPSVLGCLPLVPNTFFHFPCRFRSRQL